MSQPRRDDEGVPAVDLTGVDDVQYSFYGFADGVLGHCACCGRAVHSECDSQCPSCDAVQFKARILQCRVVFV